MIFLKIKIIALTIALMLVFASCSAQKESSIKSEKTEHIIAAWINYNEIKDQMVLRCADDLTGPWSRETVILKGSQYKEPYGGFIYPLRLDKPLLYFSLSQWDPLYNVFLVKVELEEMKSEE